MQDSSPHAWLRPKLTALVAAAADAGIARDVAVAVITDLINGPDFAAGAVRTEEGWNRDIGEPDAATNDISGGGDGPVDEPIGFGPLWEVGGRGRL